MFRPMQSRAVFHLSLMTIRLLRQFSGEARQGVHMVHEARHSLHPGTAHHAHVPAASHHTCLSFTSDQPACPFAAALGLDWIQLDWARLYADSICINVLGKLTGSSQARPRTSQGIQAGQVMTGSLHTAQNATHLRSAILSSMRLMAAL